MAHNLATLSLKVASYKATKREKTWLNFQPSDLQPMGCFLSTTPNILLPYFLFCPSRIQPSSSNLPLFFSSSSSSPSSTFRLHKASCTYILHQKLKTSQLLHQNKGRICNILPDTVLYLSHSTTLRGCYCYLNGPFLTATSAVFTTSRAIWR